MKIKKIIGRIHSIETLGTRDGPGLRCVFFLAGCNFRCKFCQNPDTWSVKGSSLMTLAEAKARLEPLVPYLQDHGGGVTVSGGEPALQAPFVIELFKLAHQLKLQTALDTNGSCQLAMIPELLAVTDIVLLDIKASMEKSHRQITGRSLAPVLEFGRTAARKLGGLVIRRVLLPGINDSQEELVRLVDYIKSLSNPVPIELIAYHRLGVHKWKELGKQYPYPSLKPPTPARWKKVAAFFREQGIEVY